MKKILATITARRNKQRGDTIVEVVLALAVLGLVLGTSSVLANRNTKTLQTSQENAYALRITQAQLEYAKSYIPANPDDLPITKFCMKSASERTPNDSSADCKKSNGGAEYKVHITVTPIEGGYSVKATTQWDTLTGTPGNVELSYKVYEKSGAREARDSQTCLEGQYFDLTLSPPECVPIAPQIRTKVQVIRPDAGNIAPSCSKVADIEKSGVRITLNSGSSKLTGSDGAAVFSDLHPDTLYQVQLNTPTGYDSCPPTSTNVITRQGSGSGPGDEKRFKIKPKCSSKQNKSYSAWTDVYTPVYGWVGKDYHWALVNQTRAYWWDPHVSGRHPWYKGNIEDWGRNSPIMPPNSPTYSDQRGDTGRAHDPLRSGQVVHYLLQGLSYYAYKYDQAWLPTWHAWEQTGWQYSHQQRTETTTTTYSCTGFSDHKTTSTATQTR